MFLIRLYCCVFVFAALVIGGAAYAEDVPLPSEKPATSSSASLGSKIGNFLKTGSFVPAPDAKPIQKAVAAKPKPIKTKPKPAPVQSTRAIAKLYYGGHVNDAYKAASYKVLKTDAKDAQVAWLAGLSAWRLNKYKDAAAYFERAAVAPNTSSALKAGAAYWAGRSNMRAGNIQNVSYWYGLARKEPETFYGLLATRALGVHYKVPAKAISRSVHINDKQLSVRPELVRAIIKQESKFNPNASNPSGATGLMQILPTTAAYITKVDHVSHEQLKNPTYNLRVGQKYLKYLLKGRNVKGNLLYLLVAYNAGPGNLAKWKSRLDGIDDGLLFIESIPSSETRAYIEHVLTNYWLEMLHRQKFSKSLDAMAAGEAPMYPGKA